MSETEPKPGQSAEPWSMDPDAAEKNEFNEEKFNEVFDGSSAKKIIAAAEKIGKPIQNNLTEPLSWSEADKQKFMDVLTGKSDGGKAEPEPAAAEPEPVVEPTPAAEPAAEPAPAAESAPAAEPAPEPASEVTRASAEKSEKKRETNKKLAAAAVTAAIASGAILGGLMLTNNNNEAQPDLPQPDDPSANEMIEEDEAREDMEDLQILDSYDYYNQIEDKRGPNCFEYSANHVADLISSGRIEVVQNEDGSYEFADKEAAYRTLILDGIMQNSEVAASYLSVMREQGLFTDLIGDGYTVQGIEQYIQSLSPEDEAALLQRMSDALENADFNETILSGLYDNFYIADLDNADGEHHIHSDSEAQLVHTVTDETGRRVVQVTFENGNSILVKVNLEDAEIQQNEDGTFTVVLRDADGNVYEYCLQPLAPKDSSIITQTPPEPTPTPTPTPPPSTSTPTPTPTPPPEDPGKNPQAEIDNAGPDVSPLDLDNDETPPTGNPNDEIRMPAIDGVLVNPEPGSPQDIIENANDDHSEDASRTPDNQAEENENAEAERRDDEINAQADNTQDQIDEQGGRDVNMSDLGF